MDEKLIPKIDFNEYSKDKYLLDLGNYEIKEENGKIFAVLKKPKYPDNYEECVRIAKNIHGYDIHIDSPAYRELMESFIKLLICRDAYWKLADNWKPNCNETNDCIINWNGEIKCEPIVCKNVILAFPNEEIRDAFYENFKDLIEKCKELL